MRSSVRQHLWLLHWLPVGNRVKFKALTLVHRALHACGPPYLQKRFLFYAPARYLRSSSQFLAHIPRFRLTRVGGSSLVVRAATTWNSLPLALCSIQDLCLLKKKLKTYLLSNISPLPPCHSPSLQAHAGILLGVSVRATSSNNIT